MAGGRLTKPGLWLGLVLAACGGRTIDDGAFDAPSGGGNPDGSCSYNGVTIANGTLVADPCVCVCDSGRFQCQAGCGGPGGASFGGGPPLGAGAPPSGGAPGAGAPSGGAPAGGAGGAPIRCGPVLRGSGMVPLIDDMEDGDGRIALVENRSGVWFTYNDGTPNGSQFPPPSASSFPMTLGTDPLSSGRYFANMYGSGFTTWGAGMGLVLTSSSCPYDAGVYQGVRFYARALEAVDLFVLFPTADTNPPSSGGHCTELTGHSCFDSYQAQVGLGADWQTYYIDFATLTQQGWGQPVVFDSKQLIGINFQIPYSPGKFSIEVDDVTFF